MTALSIDTSTGTATASAVDAVFAQADDRTDDLADARDKARAERLVAAQQRRAAARTRDLAALLRDRPDLAGVHAPADFAVEAVRWCA